MANMSVWDPINEFSSLRNTVERLFDEAWVRPSAVYSTATKAPHGIATDLWEHDDEFRVEALLPGMGPEDVDISVQGNVLTISAQRNSRDDSSDVRWYMREMPIGHYYRQFTLPAPVNGEAVEAHMENGILSLRLPKVAAARSHRIEISGHTKDAPELAETVAG